MVAEKGRFQPLSLARVCVCVRILLSQVQPGGCILEAAREASAEVEAAGGSFKCLQLQRAGNATDAAAAAAAEAAARQQLIKQRQQQKVVCHELDDVSSVSSDVEDDCHMELDSCGSNVTTSSSSSSTCMAVDTAGRAGSDTDRTVRSSTGGSSVSSRDSLSSGGMTALVASLSQSFSAMRQGTQPAAAMV